MSSHYFRKLSTEVKRRPSKPYMKRFGSFSSVLCRWSLKVAKFSFKGSISSIKSIAAVFFLTFGIFVYHRPILFWLDRS